MPQPPFRPPIAPGTLLAGPAGMTQFERDALTIVNRADGVDPQKVAAAQRLAAHQALLPPDGTPAGAPPEPVDISTLPVEKQREIYALLGTLPPAQPPPAPQTPQAWRIGVDPAVTPQRPAGLTVVHDLPKGAAAPAPIPAAPQESAPPPPPPVPEAGGLSAPSHCSHCGWDLAVTDDTAVTEQDKDDYRESFLGMKRFRRRYVILGGRLAFTFRSLTTYEAGLAIQQLIADASTDLGANRQVPNAVYDRGLRGYRMILGLERVEGFGAEPFDNPEYSVWKSAADAKQFPVQDGESPLQGVRRWVTENYFPQEGLFHAALRQFTAFDDLHNKLQAMAATDPNF